MSSPAELARYLASPAISFLTGGVVDGDLTRNTRTALSGPLREDASRLLSGAPPAGLLGSGPLASTPWGTLLCADGTSGAHFGTADARWRANEAHRRYGVGAGGADDWSRLDQRFEIARNEQSPHHFGWVLESPASQGTWAGQPTKRTALGRMRHSGLAATASRGHAVVYAGDGEHGEYLYKFVGSRRTEGALDHGVLHVARLHPDGSGEWLPLVHGQGPLTPRHGWKNQADVLLRTRLAADGVGATPLPTPGRIAASGTSGEVLCALGRLSEAGGCEAAGGGARSRATSVPLLPLAGNVLRLREEGRDPAATDFRWSDEELSGRGLRKVSARAGTRASGVVRDLHYGPGGELWAVVADDGSSDDALLVVDTADGPARCVVKAEQGVLFTAAAVATDGRQSFIAVRTVGTDRRSVVLSVRGRRSA
ncbi:PhoX family protein [Streptomyces zhihengii]|uniref:DUF839 domain-containing protein n=1 Tax=Streptomyces zhihengii TaxID=1818004 RepID=A0ABS2UQ60_9ACTN|nr:alkaline phosphatase PhoX [Streptomyces zhihengii]MBM9619676.1 DUF839 domain-containing protein [Streptomyces zhihengii]